MQTHLKMAFTLYDNQVSFHISVSGIVLQSTLKWLNLFFLLMRLAATTPTFLFTCIHYGGRFEKVCNAKDRKT